MPKSAGAEPTRRDRRARSLTYVALATVVGLYGFALVRASRFLPVSEGDLPIEGVVWAGIAAACCVAAAILVYCRAFQVTLVGRRGTQD